MLAVFFITISQGIFVRTRVLGGVLPAVVRVDAGLLLLTLARVPCLVSAGSMFAIFFITISHCAWRHFISWSNGDKETKQRKRLPTIG
jgi:hypothetical protein